MECLEINQIHEWAQTHGLDCGDRFGVTLAELPSRGRCMYANGRSSGREPAAASELVTDLGSWDECLVWITGWGVWPSGENWPRFYAWRGARAELRALDTAPGHRFGRDEAARLTELLTLIMENAWDADVLCSRDGRADGVRARISHDEWYELLAPADTAG